MVLCIVLRLMFATPEKCLDNPSHVGSGRQPLYACYSQLLATVTLLLLPFPDDVPVLHSILERFKWPIAMWTRFAPEMKARICRNVQRIKAYSTFAGSGGFETVMMLIMAGINFHLSSPLDWIPCATATEMDKTRQKVLKRLDPACCPDCIFGKIQERLPTFVFEDCHKLLPEDDACLVSKRLAYQKIDEIVQHCFDEMPHLCQYAPCAQHPDCQCQVVPPRDVADGEDPPAKRGALLRNWLFNGSSPVCTDASTFGSMSGDGGPAMWGQSVWKAELSVHKPTLVCTENVRGWEAKMQATALPDHSTYSCMIDAKKSGDAYSRKRRLTSSLADAEASLLFLFNLNHLVFEGALLF